MNPRPALPHGVLFVLGLAVLLNYVDRGNLATAAPLLQEQLCSRSPDRHVVVVVLLGVCACAIARRVAGAPLRHPPRAGRGGRAVGGGHRMTGLAGGFGVDPGFCG